MNAFEFKTRHETRLIITVVRIGLSGIDEIKIGDGQANPPRQNFVQQFPIVRVELPFAKARLLLVDGEWAIRLEEIVASPALVEQASSSGSGA